MKDWDTRFLEMAAITSTWSKDPSTKVGAVIVDSNRRVISTGYNGLPRGIMDSFDRLSNRDIKYEMIVHAEVNAILFAREDLAGATLYTYPFQPCSRCASIVIQSGISRVISYEFSNDRWTDSFKLAKDMFDEAGVELILLSAYA
jgi:dCMP deaminase